MNKFTYSIFAGMVVFGAAAFAAEQIPGVPRAENTKTSSGYASPSVKAELKINVNESTEKVTFVQDNTDPYVVTKVYKLKNVDPYILRAYLLPMVNAKQVNTSPVQVTAVKYNNGTSMLMVSAEEYRFRNSANGQGIDAIIADLDKEGVIDDGDTPTFVYFPKANLAANLMEMLKVVGSNELDPQFSISPDSMMVDAEMNSLMICAPSWSWRNIQEMLKKYDIPMPEMKLNYRVIEIYAENDDRIGVDFQSWKNNEGIDLFSAGARIRRNWSSFYHGGVDNNGSNNTNYWNFNPKWNTRYLDFLTSIGKAKVLTSGQLTAKNREPSSITVNYGYFYERNDVSTTYMQGEFAYTDPNPDVIQRQPIDKIMPYTALKDSFLPTAVHSGFHRRMLGYIDGALSYTVATWDQLPVETQNKVIDQVLGQYFGGNSAYKEAATQIAKEFISQSTALGKVLNGYYEKLNPVSSDGIAGIIHGKLQYPMAQEGFLFNLNARPVVTGEAATIDFNGNTISLLGWNSDGSPRVSESKIATRFQVGVGNNEFVIGGLKRTETVRSVAGIPFLKDIPIFGLLFTTENESIKQSQLVVVAQVEMVAPNKSGANATVTENIGQIIKDVNKGVDSKVGNMFFQQYGIDTDEIK